MRLSYSGVPASVSQEPDNGMVEPTPLLNDKANNNDKLTPFRFLGFKAVLCWHYLLLFSPIFMQSEAMLNGSGFLIRQLVLYLSMGLSFVVCGHIMRCAASSERHSVLRMWTVAFGVLGTASMFACTPLVNASAAVLYIATAIMGITEAAVMAAWLHQCINTNSENVMGSMPADMAISGIVSLLICYLATPFSYIIYLCLPIVACGGLIAETRAPHLNIAWRKAEYREIVSKKDVANIVMIYLPAALFALAFGLLQGSFLSAQIKLLMASDPIILVAIIFAAVILSVIVSLKKDGVLKISVLHRYALVLFVSGSVGLIVIVGANAGLPSSPVSLIICEIAMLAGFNLFDFGLLTLDVTCCKNQSVIYHWFSDISRWVAYTVLAIGLVLGYTITQEFGVAGDAGMTLCFICGLIVVLTVASVLVPSRGFASLENSGQESDAQAKAEPIPAVQELAGGDEAAAPLSESREIAADEEASAKCKPTIVGKVRKVEKPAELKAENAVVASMTPTSKPASEKAKSSAKDEKETPWKDACHGVAKLYGLTPRETEILIFAAKGRNPEYIQKELYLSIHTVKTHLANIYKKMNVHSSQELISLIEEYRDTYQAGSKKS